jgi:tetratricopeptide (TPR) repeat protein
MPSSFFQRAPSPHGQGQQEDDEDVEASFDTGSADSEANVFLNVYDIVPPVNSAARVFCCSRWGIYHTGVEVQGLEFSFGGHSDSSTGVFMAKPRSAKGCVFRQALPIGRADLDAIELRQLVAEISKSWPGNNYDPFQRNCNHFSESLCKELTGKATPAYINRFTKSCFVRGVFYRCLVPLGRCLRRFSYEDGGISYSNDEDAANQSSNQSSGLGIAGAKGINEVLVSAATMQKEKANQSFKAGATKDAREAYSKAIGYLDSISHRTLQEEGVRAQAQMVRLALLLNLAAVALKQEEWASALDSCNQVLSKDSDNMKALYRRGIAQSHLGAPEASLADLRQALQVTDPSDAGTVRDVRREIERVRALIEGQKDREREMAKRMMGASR